LSYVYYLVVFNTNGNQKSMVTFNRCAANHWDFILENFRQGLWNR